MANNSRLSVQKIITKKSIANAATKKTLSPPLATPQQRSRSSPRRLVPFRHPDFTDDQIQRLTEESETTKERLLKNLRQLNSAVSSDQVVGSSAIIGSASEYSNETNQVECQGESIAERVSSSRTSSPVSTGGNGDGELLAAVISRLVWLETKLSEAHNQLQDKEKMITDLEDKIGIMEQAKVAYKGSSIGALEDKCIQLQDQVHQMERFLAEYGLVWHGDSTGSTSVVPLTMDDNRSDHELSIKTTDDIVGSSSDHDFKVDYDLVIENIRDLNVLAGEGIPQICLSSDEAKLKAQDLIDHVPLTLYSNGIFLCGGPFRPFTNDDTQQCVRDLMDGYFPSELQRRYPNGVPLKVIDKRNMEFKERPSHISRCAANLSMKTLPLPVSRSPSLSPVSPTSSSASPVGSSSPDISSSFVQNISVQHLVDSLPRTSVRDGRLVDVRNSIVQLLKGSMHSMDLVVIDTNVIATDGRNPRPMTTLRIRSESGNETYLMKMYTTDTIGDVRRHLDLHRSLQSNDYDIVALYPRRVFCRLDETLEKCDLVPNAALYLRIKTTTMAHAITQRTNHDVETDVFSQLVKSGAKVTTQLNVDRLYQSGS